MKILIVEDEPSLRELMQKTLAKERYVVETAGTFHEASLKIADYSYDCILLDIMLPDGNGLKLLEMLKEQQKRESVIIISARDSIEDKVLGLEQGADDYLPKPFHLAELNARIKSVLRRQRSDGSRSLRLGNLRIEPDSFRVFVDDKELELLKKEYDILFYFANRPNHIIDKAVLAEAVWGDHADDADNFQKWLLEEFDDNGDTVMFAPGAPMYATPGKGKNEIRIAYILKQDKLERAMDLLALGIKAYNNR